MPFSLRHPRLTLGAALLVIVVLGVIGLRVQDSLSPTSLDVAGTESSRAEAELHRYFGDSAPFAILLRGPEAELERQGPELVRALRADPEDRKVTTISPWDKGSVARLRPGPNRALILVDFHVSVQEAVDHTVPYLNELLEHQVKAPVTATQTGFASLSRAIQDESISSSERGELIALPVLLLVLFFVFRSPIAALIPLCFGAITVVTSRGVLQLASHSLSIDAFALTVSTMMGLALGVDYALLMVSRYREELAAGLEPLQAVINTRRSAGRTIIFAGSTLFLSMFVSIFILPGSLLVSLAGTVIIVVVISVLVATLVAPPLLVMVGTNVDRWRIGSAAGGRSRLMAFVNAALRRPVVAVLVIGAVVLCLAAPAVGLKTGPPSTEQLPTDNQQRKDAEAVDAGAGPGWEAPYILVASTERGPITADPVFHELTAWQGKVAEDPAVQAVIGPAQVGKKVAPLQKSSRQIMGANGEGGRRLAELRELGPKLARAERGIARIRSGLIEAAEGAGLLGQGSGRAEGGATTIAGGIARAQKGGERAIGAIARIAGGAGELAAGQSEAKVGSLSLKLGLSTLLKDLRSNGLGKARQLRDTLQKAAAANPELAGALSEAQRLVLHLSLNRNEVRHLRGESQRLHGGESRLLAGSQALHKGAKRLETAARELPAGLNRLYGGARRLATGLTQLQAGAEALETHLSSGSQKAEPLQTGLHHASVKVSAGAGALTDQVGRLHHRSPGIFESGYYVLSALDGAGPRQRQSAATAIDLEKGGQAAAILVIPHYTFNTPGSVDLYQRLQRYAGELEARSGLRVGVAGGAAQLTDYSNVTRESIPIVVIAITLVTFLVMVVVLRAVLLAALAVALNLLSVAVAFGVLTLLFNVPAGYPLGGNSYVDAVGAVMIFGVIFGLSIDYAVFLLMRMRESHDEDGDHARAIAFGLEKTARVITGAALIMMAVFIVFAGAPIATVSQLGIGLTVAVLLDATVVRIVLLPALMLLLGDRVWWLPGPLQRLLPEIDLHGEARVGEAG
ncbi:MAG: MMPL family transporter [Actinobacteria bacterium]|nr:MMPL family transporter [Actinomycetota bacterium]